MSFSLNDAGNDARRIAPTIAMARCAGSDPVCEREAPLFKTKPQKSARALRRSAAQKHRVSSCLGLFALSAHAFGGLK